MQAIDRVVDVLTTLNPTGGRGPSTLAEVSAAVQLSHATVRRILKALEHHEWVEFDPVTRRYSLGRRLIEVGLSAWREDRLRILWREAAEGLARQFDVTVYLAVRDGDDSFFVDRVEGTGALRVIRPLGVRAPLVGSGASDQVFLAFATQRDRQEVLQRTADNHPVLKHADLSATLASVRTRGFSVSTSMDNLAVGIAAPIFDASGVVAAALSVNGPRDPRVDDDFAALGRQVASQAAGISRQLGFAGEHAISD